MNRSAEAVAEVPAGVVTGRPRCRRMAGATAVMRLSELTVKVQRGAAEVDLVGVGEAGAGDATMVPPAVLPVVVPRRRRWGRRRRCR